MFRLPQNLFFKPLFLLLFLGTQACAQGLKLDLRLERRSTLPYMPIFARVTVINATGHSIQIDPFVYDYKPLRFVVESGAEIDTSCVVAPVGSDVEGAHEMQELPAGSAVNAGSREIAGDDGLLAPGKYRVKAVWDTTNTRKFVNGFHGRVESNWVDVRIDSPSPEDASFLEDLKKMEPQRYKCVLQESSVTVETYHALYARHPDSHYTELKVDEYLTVYEMQPPSDFLRELDQGWSRDIRQQVPDFSSETGLRTVSVKELLRWRIATAQAYIRRHPSSPRLRHYQLVIATNALLLKDEELADKYFSLVEQDSASEEGKWSRQMRALWRERKSRNSP